MNVLADDFVLDLEEVAYKSKDVVIGQGRR